MPSQLTIAATNANSRKSSSAKGFLPRLLLLHSYLLVLLLRQISDDYYKSTNISSLQFVNRHTLHMNARRNQCSLVCDKETFRSFMIALLTTLSSLTL